METIIKYKRGLNPNTRKNSPFIKGHKINVGRKFSEKHKIKISKSNIGKHNHSLEWRENMSKIQSRKHFSNEHRENLSKSHKGYIMPQEQKEKISKSNKGRIMLEEQKKKLSDIHKGKKISKEHKEKLRLSHLGKHLSEEHKNKIGMANKGKVRSEKERERIRKMNIGRVSKLKGIPRLEETKKKIGDKNRNHKITEETRKRLSESHRGLNTGNKNSNWRGGIKEVNCYECGKRVLVNNYRIKNNKYIFCSNYCFGKYSSRNLIGEKHHNWLGGKSFEPYDKGFNDKLKRLIRKRDNQICMLCGVHREKLNRALDVHHINYNKKLSIPQNCISLCRNCHARTHSNRKHWTKFFQDLLSERYGYGYERGEILIEVGDTFILENYGVKN